MRLAFRDYSLHRPRFVLADRLFFENIGNELFHASFQQDCGLFVVVGAGSCGEGFPDDDGQEGRGFRGARECVQHRAMGEENRGGSLGCAEGSFVTGQEAD